MSVFKEAVFSVVYGYSNIDKPIGACWHLELPALAWHGSDLSADCLEENGPRPWLGPSYGSGPTALECLNCPSE